MPDHPCTFLFVPVVTFLAVSAAYFGFGMGPYVWIVLAFIVLITCCSTLLLPTARAAMASEWPAAYRYWALVRCAIDPKAMDNVGYTLSCDRKFVLGLLTIKGLSRGGGCLCCCFSRWKQRSTIDIVLFARGLLGHDRNLMMKACRLDGDSLQFASRKLRGDKGVVLAAIGSKPDSIKYADPPLNQDPDCLKKAGVWDKGYRPNLDAKKIVLSTRFSLSPDSNSKATKFAILLKESNFIRNKRYRFYDNEGFVVYSPNAVQKSTCDEEWTRYDHRCRGTNATCGMQPYLKTGIPLGASCWRYSFRYQLQLAQHKRGFMIQLAEICCKTNELTRGRKHTLGDGQRIETDMAAAVGTKVFRVFTPLWNNAYGDPSSETELDFQSEDIDAIVDEVKKWYQEDCKDMRECNIRLTRTGEVDGAPLKVDVTYTEPNSSSTGHTDPNTDEQIYDCDV